MADERPQLRLIVDAETGELVEQDDRETLIEQLQAEKKGQSLQIGKLKRELRELRLAEPEAMTILSVLKYWRERCKPAAEIAPGGKRWEKVRARLRERLLDRGPWTPEELKLAVDGALLDPWLSGRDRRSKGYLEAETIFRDEVQVQKLRDLALGFQAQAGVHLRDLIDVAGELRVVSWRVLLRKCECEHRRIEHSRPDPSREGREPCFLCACEDFDEDPFYRLETEHGLS